MKHVWLVFEDLDGFDTKVFSSKVRALNYFKKVLSSNDISFSEAVESGEGWGYSVLYTQLFWIQLSSTRVNMY